MFGIKPNIGRFGAVLRAYAGHAVADNAGWKHVTHRSGCASAWAVCMMVHGYAAICIDMQNVHKPK